jgi:hypothetical protein
MQSAPPFRPHPIAHKSTPPAGLVVRAYPQAITLSLWCGNRELIAELDASQADAVGKALSASNGTYLLSGTVREFNAPQL